MPAIKTTCTTCGELTLQPDELELYVDATGSQGFYSFTCAGCRTMVRRAADEHVVRLLVAGGVAAQPQPPVRRPLAAERPPLTYDDLLDLHELLATDDWIERVLSDR